MSVPAVAYYRMSTDAQEASIPRQRDWAREAAGREGVRVVAEFDDPGIAGAKVDQRPGLQAMLDHCERQFQQGTPAEAVLVWDPDRLSRADSLKTSAVLSRLKDAGVCKLLTASDGWVDLEDVTHRVLYLLKQDLARSGFCEGLARNTLAGKQKKAAQGFWLGGLPPFGYRLEGGRLVPDPEDAAVIAWLFAAYAGGAATMADLLDELHRRGVVPTRERRRRAAGQPPREPLWRKTALRCILLNRVYLGHTVWNLRHYGTYARVQGGRVVKDDSARAREQDRRRRGLKRPGWFINEPGNVLVAENTHPPLTDPATFEAVQRRLKSNCRLTTPARQGGGWLLTGMIRCGACGSPMHGHRENRVKDPGKPIRYYVCGRATKQHACWAGKLVRQELLVKEVVETVRERFAEGPALDALVAEVARLAARGREGAEAERARLRARLGELAAKEKQGTANLALLPPDLIPGVVAQVRQWQADREQTERDLSKLEAAADAHESLSGRVEGALTQLRNLGDVIASAEPAEARAALGSVVSEVRVIFRPAKEKKDVRVAAVEVEMADALVKLFATCWPCGPEPRPPGGSRR